MSDVIPREASYLGLGATGGQARFPLRQVRAPILRRALNAIRGSSFPPR